MKQSEQPSPDGYNKSVNPFLITKRPDDMSFESYRLLLKYRNKKLKEYLKGTKK